MTASADLALRLARAFRAGPWTADELLARGGTIVDDSKRLPKLIARLRKRFSQRPLGAELAAFLRESSLFERIVSRQREVKPAREAFALWPVLPQRPLPRLDTVGEAADWLGLTSAEAAWFADLRNWVRFAPAEPLRHYRARWIRKRHGGARLIEAPKPRLKEIQRRILHELLNGVPSHEAAHGFRRRRGIQSFAAPHVGRAIVLRLDLADFFPTVTRRRVAGIFFALGYSPTVARVLAGLCTVVTPPDVLAAFPLPEQRALHFAAEDLYRPPHLPQGAPTSPALANLCAYRLDARLTGLARAAGGSYTRYADDLVFSGDEAFARGASRFLTLAAAIALEEGFRVNFRKTRVMRRATRQSAAGLVLNDKLNVRREEYERLKAILCNCERHGPASQNREGHDDFRAHLAGRVAFVSAVHPQHGEKLRRRLERIDWTLIAVPPTASAASPPVSPELSPGGAE